MTQHRRRLATLATLTTLATLATLAMTSACDRVVELYTIDGPPFEPPFFDARVIDARVFPPDSPFADVPAPIDAGVSLDAPFGSDGPGVVIDAPSVAPPPGSPSVRTRT